jgi:hypothetical protein
MTWTFTSISINPRAGEGEEKKMETWDCDYITDTMLEDGTRQICSARVIDTFANAAVYFAAEYGDRIIAVYNLFDKEYRLFLDYHSRNQE